MVIFKGSGHSRFGSAYIPLKEAIALGVQWTAGSVCYVLTCTEVFELGTVERLPIV